METKLTRKMQTLYSELLDGEYVEVFGKEYNSAIALHNKGLIDLRRAKNKDGTDAGMWEAKVIKAL